MAKDFKFQYSFKMHSTERNLTEDYSLKTILSCESNFYIKICKNLGLLITLG